jgi:hypothetical protein
MKSMDVKKVKTNIEVNLPIDNRKDSGVIGRHVHEELSKVLPMNHGNGPDVVSAGLEIKSRQIHSKADHTQCSMTRESIINTPYASSPLREKMQKQLRIKVNSGIGTKVEERIYDMSDDDIQLPLEEDYEHCRQQLSNGSKGIIRTAPNGLVVLEEIKNKNDRYKVRITDKGMKTIENRSLRDKKAWNEIFV